MAEIKGSCIWGLRQLNHWLYLLWVYWSSDDAGDVQDVIIPCRINGDLICVDTRPGILPIANGYDVTLTDDLMMDVMGGTLAGRSNTDAERAWPTDDGTHILRRRIYNCLTLGVANAVVKGATEGYIDIYFERRNKKGV